MKLKDVVLGLKGWTPERFMVFMGIVEPVEGSFFSWLKGQDEETRSIFLERFSEAARPVYQGLVEQAADFMVSTMGEDIARLEATLDDLDGYIAAVKAGRAGTQDRLLSKRALLRSDFHEDAPPSDQSLGEPAPPLIAPRNVIKVFSLPPPESEGQAATLARVLRNRRSRRVFGAQTMPLSALSYLLWCSSGVTGRSDGPGAGRFRTAPSAGARHATDLYVLVRDVEGLPSGCYQYRPLTHDVALVKELGDFSAEVSEGCLGQRFAAEANAVFVWVAVPYRMEWRYTIHSVKPLLLDAGHACQNLYLGAEALGYGTCAIAAYDQVKMDGLLGVDGENEMTLYISPVGLLK